MIDKQMTDEEIDLAWTAMILDIPADRVKYLKELKKSYRLFLLSNTNEIHRIKFHRSFREDFGYSFYDLFEHSFYSHKMGIRKPNPQIYVQALKEANLNPEETLFIDDMVENIEAAKTTGMNVLHIEPGTLLEKLPGYLEDHQQ
jgi:putative hydrolase of the HAD superfamily